jgi:hypothetical protein
MTRHGYITTLQLYNSFNNNNNKSIFRRLFIFPATSGEFSTFTLITFSNILQQTLYHISILKYLNNLFNHFFLILSLIQSSIPLSASRFPSLSSSIQQNPSTPIHGFLVSLTVLHPAKPINNHTKSPTKNQPIPPKLTHPKIIQNQFEQPTNTMLEIEGEMSL